MKEAYGGIRPVIRECEKAMALARPISAAQLGDLMDLARAADVVRSSEVELRPKLTLVVNELLDMVERTIQHRRCSPNGYLHVDTGVLERLRLECNKIKDVITSDEQMRQTVTNVGYNGIGKSLEWEMKRFLLALSSDEADDGGELGAVNYVLDKLGYQAARDEDDEDAQGGAGNKTRAEVAKDITEGKHPLVDFQGPDAEALRALAQKMHESPELLAEEKSLHEQFHNYGCNDSDKALRSLIVPIGNTDGVTTTFDIVFTHDHTPHLLVVLREVSAVIREVTTELIGLWEGRKALKEAERDRLKACQKMCLFAVYGRASASMEAHRHDWATEVTKLQHKTDLKDFSDDFQILYRKPIMIHVGRRGENNLLVTVRHFRELLDDIWKGAAPLFIEEAKLFLPQQLKGVGIQDSIGMDGIARHQRLLAGTMSKSDHVVFVVEKDLKAGMTLSDRQCEAFYERLLRGEAKASILRTVERCDRLTAAEFDAKLKRGGPAETGAWLESSLDFLEAKLYHLAESIDLDDRDRIIQEVLDGIRGRSLTVRPMLGCSLLLNAKLRDEHAGLLDHTGIKGLLAILVGAANEAPLRLARQALAVIQEEVDRLNRVRQHVGAELSRDARDIIKRWQHNKENLTLWMDPSSILCQGIRDRLQAKSLESAFLLTRETRASVEECLRTLLVESCEVLLEELDRRCDGSVDKMAECMRDGVLKKVQDEDTELSFAEIVRGKLRACGKGGKPRMQIALEEHLKLLEGPEGPAAQLLKFVSQQIDVPLNVLKTRNPQAYEQLMSRKNCLIESREHQGLLPSIIVRRHTEVFKWSKLYKKVEDGLLGRRFERLENVRKGGVLRDFLNGRPPRDAQQSVDEFKSWFRTTFAEKVVDKLVDQFAQELQKKADTAVNRSARQVAAGGKKKKKKGHQRQRREDASSLKAQLESASLFIYAGFFEVPEEYAPVTAVQGAGSKKRAAEDTAAPLSASDIFRVHEAEKLEQILDTYRRIFLDLIGKYRDTTPALDALVQRIQTHHAGAVTVPHTDQIEAQQGGQPIEQGDSAAEETKASAESQPAAKRQRTAA